MVSNTDTLSRAISRLVGNNSSQDLEKEILELKNKILTLTQDLHDSQFELRILKSDPNTNQKLLSYVEAINDNTTLKRKLERENSSLKENIQSLNNTISKLNNKIENMNMKIEEYKEIIDIQRKGIEDLKNTKQKKTNIFSIFSN